MSKGFIPIRRTLFEHFLFKEHRVFSRFEAWLDLIQLASFTDGQTDMIKGKPITRNRGEIVASIRWISNRWNWSIHKTCDYIEVLRSQKMVVVGKENGITRLSLVNFERYNSIGKDDKNTTGNGKRNDKTVNSKEFDQNKDTVLGTEEGTPGEHPGNSPGTNYNKDNTLNKENDGEGAGAPPSPRLDLKLKEKQEAMLQRRKDFANQLAPYVKTYSREMVGAFFKYWVEPNKSKTRMKFELEQTWELSLRLAKWEDNELKWKKTPKSGEHSPAIQQKPVLSKAQIDLNYLYGRYLEDPKAITVISIDSLYYNLLKTSGLISFSEQLTAEIKESALAHIALKKITVEIDTVQKMMKRFGVLEFFKQLKARGEGTVFHEK